MKQIIIAQKLTFIYNYLVIFEPAKGYNKPTDCLIYSDVLRVNIFHFPLLPDSTFINLYVE